MASDYTGAFAVLREILLKHAEGMTVQADSPTDCLVVTQAIGPNKQPLWFGAVQMKKSAVTYHLMPLYFKPVLQPAVPPELRPRKQGKTYFNLQRLDAKLFAQVDALTQQGREHYERHGLLLPGLLPQEQFDAALHAGGEDPEALARLRKARGQQAAANCAATIKKNTPKKKACSRRAAP